MKKLALVLSAMLMLVSPPTPARADSLDQNRIYIAAVNALDNSEYVILRNDGADLSTTGMKLLFFNSNNNLSQTIEFGSGTFLGNSSILVSQTTESYGSFDKSYGTNKIPLSGGRLALEVDGSIILENCWGTVKSCSTDRIATAMNSTSTLLMSPCSMPDSIETSDCHLLKLSMSTPALLFGGWRSDAANEDSDDNDSDETPTLPGGFINKDCESLKITEIGAYPGMDNYDRQFIELTNDSSQSINIKGCRLMTNRSTTKYAAFGDETLEPNGVKLLFIDEIEGLLLSKTTAGTVYVLSSDGKVELDTQAYPALKSGTSWWLVGKEWQISKQPSPGLPNSLPPVNYCDGVRLSEIGANLDEQFIEVVNISNQPVSLSGCQLMTNRSATKLFEFGEETLKPGDFRIIKISDTLLNLTKTTTGVVYLYGSDGELEVDGAKYANLNKDTSWSFVDGEWVQTYVPTPGHPNVFQEYPACQDGYYRNLETGRCNKMVIPATIASCATGYYRNELTNRCRKIATVSTLTPCKEGQERNPETNRCRKIATTTSALKSCADGYERNPETNRCRKIVSTAAGQFAVEAGPVSSTGGHLLIAALGTTVITTGLLLFQYKMEIGQFIRKLRDRFRVAS